ncbi:MAG: nitrous oxide reductase family maturation protein NosD [Rhodoplanes sp.]|uniref:nitrous oxide reductase family maturation protein NosD n=1 Tax=Rhodoplanes sp. TaxID=1968906 RepID=UPI001850C422|nr:nitrous oxide reductase family maturation protein NosD [Rhodoplanes sp.]NVO12459.1 nitrous oxide reductase family maturation protein NosD [Rhodoplanes sp.]
MTSGAQAATIAVEPGTPLQGVLDAAAPGDVVVLKTGRHRGPVRLAVPLTLRGEDGAVLDGDHDGSVVTVTAVDAAVESLIIVGSGSSLDTMDSGVFLARTAARARVAGNRIEGNLFGVYVHGAEGAAVERNAILGRRGGRTSEAGNGVSVWNAPGARIVGNDIRFGRDGVFVISSRNNIFADNRFQDVRFAVHYMYTNDSTVAGNVSAGNHVGFAVMYSSRLKITGNRSERDRDHGFLFNYANNATVAGNVVLGGPIAASTEIAVDDQHAALLDRARENSGMVRRAGPEKCVFIYNANANRFTGNRFEGCEIGIHFTAGSEKNEIVGNAFVRNRHQVKYVGTRSLDWSKDGRGNFWSDNPGFDLDGDGVADTAYRPNDIIDKVLWTAPAAKILVASPAVQMLRWAQAQFPALYPGGVVDSHPLMAAPTTTATTRTTTTSETSETSETKGRRARP